MKYLLFFFCAAVFAGPAIAESWTQIRIRRAFISPETYQANRDTFSDPEFGWNILCGKELVMRAGLYDRLYVPPKCQLTFVFVERDVLFDDTVAVLAPDLKQTRQKLVNGDDEFELEISSFDPEAQSGPDAANPRALRPGEILHDRVSFTDGDRTDRFVCSGTAYVASFPSIEFEGAAWTDDRKRLSRMKEKTAFAVVSPPGMMATDYSVFCAQSPQQVIHGLSLLAASDDFLFPSALSAIDIDSGLRAACAANVQEPACIYYFYIKEPARRSGLHGVLTTAPQRAAFEKARQDAPEESNP